MSTWLRLLLPVLALVSGCAAPAAGPGAVPADPAGSTREVDLGARPFLLTVPDGVGPGEPRPLVVGLHGWGGSGAKVAAQLGLAAAAERHGLLLALPEGTVDSTGRRFWNASPACCNLDGRSVDDVAYLADVVAAVSEEQAVDPDRVYAVGLSNGGFMAHRLACERADLVTAVVSVAGARTTEPEACTPSQGVSVLQVHGTADAVIRYDGGTLIPGHPYTSAAATVGAWRGVEHCRPGPGAPGAPLDADSSLPGAETTRTTWRGCDDGAAVSIWSVDGGRHVPHVTPGFGDAVVAWLARRDDAARPAQR